MQDLRKLIVLEKAHALLVRVDRAAARIKGTQYTELKKQLFKSALSVVSNISEGRNKDRDREFLRFLNMAFGSAGELQSQIRVAGNCCLIPHAESVFLDEKAAEIGRMLNGLINKLREDLGLDKEDENGDGDGDNDVDRPIDSDPHSA